MSTQYTILDKGNYVLEADERSNRIGLSIRRKVTELEIDYSVIDEGEIYKAGDWRPESETDAIFTAEDLLRAAVELVRVASYIADEPEKRVRLVVLEEALRLGLAWGYVSRPTA